MAYRASRLTWLEWLRSRSRGGAKAAFGIVNGPTRGGISDSRAAEPVIRRKKEFAPPGSALFALAERIRLPHR